MPVVVGVTGGTIDFVTASKYRAKLQLVADNAAVAAAREVSLANTKVGQIESAALAAATRAAGSSGVSGNPTQLNSVVKVSQDRSRIEVTVSFNWKPTFAQFIDSSVSTVSASAVAKVVGSGNICMMGLNNDRAKTILLTKNASLIGNGCGIFSSSSDRRSITVQNDAKIRVEFVCARGGIKQRSGSQILPTGTTDCPTPPDPLAERPMPKVGLCDFNNVVLKNSTTTLRPGVYCGGLKITKNSVPLFEKGIYIIKDGPLVVSTRAKLIANGVGFFLTGTNASFKFFPKSEIALRAPEDGLMAGILIFQDPAIPGVDIETDETTRNLIRSDNARMLEGTIYLPRGRLRIDGGGTIAQDSAYTTVIADRIVLEEGPTMVLNANYKSTSVPVPEGLAGGRVVLSE